MRAVAVVGAGVAGTAAAIRLAEQGHEVQLIEAVAQPQPLGAGLLLQPTGQAVLQAMGLLDTALAHGARVERLFGDTAGGRTVLDMAYERLQPGLHGLGLQRGALMGLLWQRLRSCGAQWRCGIAVDSFEQDDHGVRLYADGAEVGRYAALILANGSFSKLRLQMTVRQSGLMGPGRHIPFIDRQSLTLLAGSKTGLLFGRLAFHGHNTP